MADSKKKRNFAEAKLHLSGVVYLHSVESIIEHSSMKRVNKMSADDVAKLKAVALYVLDKCGETDFIHLFKIIYFAERSLYAKYGQHLVKDTLEEQDRYVDCSDFKKISKERFSELFSGDKMKGKINKDDLAEIRKAICSYENISMKLFWIGSLGNVMCC